MSTKDVCLYVNERMFCCVKESRKELDQSSDFYGFGARE